MNQYDYLVLTGPPKDKFLAPPLLVKLVIPTPRVVFEGIQEDTDSINNEGRLADLEGLEEEREVARRRCQRYQQRMAKAYRQTVTQEPSQKGSWC